LPRGHRLNPMLDLGQSPSRLDLSEVFGNQHPVEFEIGIGKGFFLMRSAQCHPDRNYLGIEYARKYLEKARKRIAKRPLPNARLIHGEALDFMREYLGDRSIDVIHLYFPDPWPKKRHHKRRIFNHEFLRESHRVLTDSGDLLVATDHCDYWDWMMEKIATQNWFRPSDRLPSPARESDRLTNYERKYVQEGRSIFRAGYRKADPF